MAASCFLFCANISAQNLNRDSIETSQYLDKKFKVFLQKSKEQKKLAWILLGSGISLNLLNTMVNGSSDNTGADFILEAGALATSASIPLFFSASNNMNKARLVYFEKKLTMASSDSLRKIYLKEAANYFSDKAKANFITAVILSAAGGVFIVAAANTNSSDNSGNFLFVNWAPLFYAVAGIAVVIASVPFYIRGANLQKTAKVILRTERIPTAGLMYSSYKRNRPQIVAVGIRIPL